MLLNTGDNFTIDNSNEFSPLTGASFDTTLIANNPSLKILYQQTVIAEKKQESRNCTNVARFQSGIFESKHYWFSKCKRY